MADPRTIPLACPVALLLAACASGPGDEAPAPAELPAQGEQSGTVGALAPEAEAAIEAIRAGDHRRAAELLEGMTFTSALAAGKAALAAGNPRDALAPLDEALALRPRDKDALFARAEAAFATAEAGDPQAGFFYGDAAAGFREAAKQGAGVEAAFRASRAAYLAGETAEALDLARQGMAWLDGAEGRRGGLHLPLAPERTWADAAFAAYIAARNSNSSEAGSLFSECEDALGRLAAVTPTEPYAFEQLANLYVWGGRRAEALTHLEHALALAPTQEALHNALVRELRADAYERSLASSGALGAAPAEDASAAEREAHAAAQRAAVRAQRDAVVARYEAYQVANPENPLGYWYAASERFHRALESYEAGALDEQDFHRAERDFRKCRELDERYADTCRAWEALGRAGIGWCRHWSQDLEGAVEAFWSTEEVLPGGLDLQYEGRLASALVGLATVAGAYAARADDAEALTKAAALGDALFARRPENANLANNAGFLNRDAAVLVELASRRKRAEAADAQDAEAADALRAEAAQLRERAQRLMERSYAAYQVAAELAPDDVRVVNDTGLVMAYYLRTDAAAARRYFVRALELGKAQLAEYAARGEEAPVDLRVAYGDAHQNMGTLALTCENDLVSTREWFVKACEVAPDDRPEVDQILPALDASIAAGAWTDELRAFERMLVWKD